MRLDIVTLFPGMFVGPLTESIPARARAQGIVDLRIVDLRRYSHDRRRSVDDRPYGGGPGMVLLPGPLFEAIEAVRSPQAHVVWLTPQGRRFEQSVAERLAGESHLVLVSGHYEGADERARQVLADEEISIGDYVLSNGSLAAMVVADAVIRLLPGVLGCAESAEEESFNREVLLDFPQYTRPPEFRGMRPPAVLLSGDHGKIERWRARQRLLRTIARRPDLLERAPEREPSAGK